MNPVEFSFKSYPKPIDMPRPVIKATFTFNGKKDDLVCIIDSGADFTVIPKWMGEIMFGIDFKKSLASEEIIREYVSLEKKDILMFIDKMLKNNPKAIPSPTECACGKVTNGFLFPIFIKLGDNQEIPIMVQWTEAKDISPLLGRIGIFNHFSSVTFNKKQSNGQFLP